MTALTLALACDTGVDFAILRQFSMYILRSEICGKNAAETPAIKIPSG